MTMTEKYIIEKIKSSKAKDEPCILQRDRVMQCLSRSQFENLVGEFLPIAIEHYELENTITLHFK